MAYLFIILEIAWGFILIFTSYTIARILEGEGKTQKTLYGIRDLLYFFSYAKAQRSSYFKSLFWANVISVIMILFIALLADSYYR
ncbi:hypothetical protein [uncultured Acetobacteroides sp.]|uniref:hypothetical protein n=1 Tax=uncultured Acetobacteroides sp. TaxID=1760811 RepID=UPI0029F46C00|nr:hypothetical protein [uncultured Acetobacteroides sp.]